MRSFRDITSTVPLNVRLRFLESMSFANGKLVHVALGDLRGVLRESDIEALMLACGCKQGYVCNPFKPELGFSQGLFARLQRPASAASCGDVNT